MAFFTNYTSVILNLMVKRLGGQPATDINDWDIHYNSQRNYFKIVLLTDHMFFNQLVGCGLVGVGIWILVDDTLKEMAKVTALSILTYSGIAIIALGAIIMVIGFFGCCGAIRESQCLLSMVGTKVVCPCLTVSA